MLEPYQLILFEVIKSISLITFLICIIISFFVDRSKTTKFTDKHPILVIPIAILTLLGMVFFIIDMVQIVRGM